MAVSVIKGADKLEQMAQRQVTIDVLIRFFTYTYEHSDSDEWESAERRATKYVNNIVSSWEDCARKEGIDPLDINWEEQRNEFIEDKRKEFENLLTVTQFDIDKYIEFGKSTQKIK